MSFKFSPKADGNKTFLTKFSEVTGGRLDVSSHSMRSIFVNSSYKLEKLTSYFQVNPLTKKNSQSDWFSFVPMERVSDLDSDVKGYEKIDADKIKGYTPFQEGDFLFAKITPCMENGKMAIAKLMPTSLGFGSTEFHIFRKKKELSVEFLRALFLINSFRKYAKCNFTGTAGHQRVPPEFFTNLKIPIPPKEIQEEIVAKMDKAYSNKKQKEQEAEKLLNSIDDYLLGELGIKLPEPEPNTPQSRIFKRKWNEISGGRLDPFYNAEEFVLVDKLLQNNSNNKLKIQDLVTPVNGVTYKSSDETTDGHKILRANNIDLKTNELVFSDVKCINASIPLKEQNKLKAKDILMCSASGSKEHAGKVAYVYKDLEYHFGAFMLLLRPKNNSFSSLYLYNFLSSKIYRKILFRFLGGTNINNVGFEKIKNLLIPLPPLPKQNEIAEHITTIRNKAKQLQQQAISELETAKSEVEKMILG
jgi:restriction endonuclease S subunit